MPSWSGAGRGAATGAGLASFVPGIGPLVGGGIGALIGGLFGGGDDKDKEKEKDDLDISGDLTQLRSNATDDRARGDALNQQGDLAMAPVLQHLQALVRGDEATTLAATKGQRGRVMDQYDAARRAAAQFGPRGGGQQQAIANSYFDQANQLSDITADAQTGAAQQLGQFATQLNAMGLASDQLANADLGTIIQAVLGQQNIEAQKRGQNMDLWGGIGSAAGNIIGAILTKGKG